jgi:hypothetical protein
LEINVQVAISRSLRRLRRRNGLLSLSAGGFSGLAGSA